MVNIRCSEWVYDLKTTEGTVKIAEYECWRLDGNKTVLL